jgi:general stress protein YciG
MSARKSGLMEGASNDKGGCMAQGQGQTSRKRGFAAMSAQDRERAARAGGQNSPTKFTPGSRRAKEAGRRGGLASRNRNS